MLLPLYSVHSKDLQGQPDSMLRGTLPRCDDQEVWLTNGHCLETSYDDNNRGSIWEA